MTATPNWINVSNYASVNAALATVTGNSVLYFPAGSYSITSSITMPTYDITFVGDGQGMTTLTYTMTSGDVFLLNNLNYFSMNGLNIQGPTSGSTSGAAIHLEYVSNIFLTEITISGGYIGLQIDGSNTANSNFRYVVRDFFIYSTKSTAILIGSNVSANPPADISIYSGVISNCGAGITINSTGGSVIENTGATGCTGTGIAVVPGTGQWITTAHFTDVYADTCGSEGWLIGNTGTGTVADVALCNCFGSYNTQAGVDINGSGVNGVSITGGYFGHNGQDGIRLDAGTNILINGASVYTNNTSNAGYSGITIQSGSGFQIVNCVSGLGGFNVSSGNKQAYGISINSSSSNNFIVTSNRLPSNVTGGIGNFATGSNQVVANNLNF